MSHQRRLPAFEVSRNSQAQLGPEHMRRRGAGKACIKLFATISDKGLGHLCFKDNRFYVAASKSNAIFEVRLDGTATRIIGNGERGIVDGARTKARMSLPNGIGCHPWTHRLYINEFVGDPASLWPPRAIIREIILDTPST
jgi:hypothetical protein